MPCKKRSPSVMYDPKEVTIVMEGVFRFIDIKIALYNYYNMCSKIIISSYFDTPENKKIKETILCEYPNVEIIDNCPEEVDDISQPIAPLLLKGSQLFVHMPNLLNKVTTPYVIKTRVDQAFTNMEYFIEKTVSNPHKITCFPYYVRAYDRRKFHPPDMLIGSSTAIMRDVWCNPYDAEIRRTREIIEQCVFEGYICRALQGQGCTEDLHSLTPARYGVLMSRLFDVIDHRKLQPYSVHGYDNFFSQSEYRQFDPSLENNTAVFFEKGC